MPLQLEDRRTQVVFHGVLMEYLVTHGSSSAADIKQRGLWWFWLRMTNDEIDEVVESAKRHQLIAKSDDGLLTRTDEGKNVPPPRGVSASDILAYLGGFLGNFTTLERLGALAGIIAVFVSLGVDPGFVKEHWPWVLVAVVAVVLLPALIRGFAGELKLKAAARAWPRLAQVQPEIARYYGRKSQPWLGFSVIPLIVAAIVVGALASLVLGGVLLLLATVAAAIVLPSVGAFSGPLGSRGAKSTRHACRFAHRVLAAALLVLVRSSGPTLADRADRVLPDGGGSARGTKESDAMREKGRSALGLSERCWHAGRPACHR